MKVALIYNFESSGWISCQRITKNLATAYKMIKALDIQEFSLGTVRDYSLWQLTQDLVKYRPDHIVYLDHKPNPLELHVLLIPRLLQNGLRPSFGVHLYGDFSLEFQKWKTLADLMEGQKVNWYAPSLRQKWMLDNFFTNQVIVSPFSYDPSEFAFNPLHRARSRSTFNLSENKRIYLYTGRLSEQKRINLIIKSFHRHCGEDPDKELWLVGAFDDIGETFNGRHGYVGEYENKIRMTLVQTKNPRIKLIPFCNTKELNAIYHAADAFVSLSVHNDEDFGMSVLEAGVMGLPLIISSWGGFKDFVEKTNHTKSHLIEVALSFQGKSLNLEQLEKAWRDDSLHCSVEERTALSEKFKQHYSLTRSSEILSENLKHLDIFTGLKPLMGDLVAREEIFAYPYREENSAKFTKIYCEVYAAYIR